METKTDSMNTTIKNILESGISCYICTSDKLTLRNLPNNLYEVACATCGSKFIIQVESNSEITDDTKLLIKAAARLFDKEGKRIDALIAKKAIGFGHEKNIEAYKRFRQHMTTKHKRVPFQEIVITVISLLKNTSSMTSLISIRMSPYMRNKILKLANKNGVVFAEYIRKLISDGIMEEYQEELLNEHSQEKTKQSD